MESQPQNPEFRNNPDNFHPWVHLCNVSDIICTCKTHTIKEKTNTRKNNLQIKQ